jgi:hypothetical protein
MTVDAFVASVRAGTLLPGGSHAAITFDVGDASVSLAVPVIELTGLLTLCMGLSAEAAARRGTGEAEILPVEDWQVGRTTSEAMVLRLCSESGASLTYGFDRRQALQLCDAITRASAPPRRDPARAMPDPAHAAHDSRLQLLELITLRDQCRDHPAAMDLVDHCLALLVEIDAANDEGRAVYERSLLQLVTAAQEHLRSLGDPIDGPIGGPPAASL